MFTIVIPVLNQHEEACKYLDSWFKLTKGSLKIVFIDNGSAEPFNDNPWLAGWRSEGHAIKVIRNDGNVGVYPTFRQGLEETKSDWIFYSHSDVEMLDWGWDEKLKHILTLLCVRSDVRC